MAKETRVCFGCKEVFRKNDMVEYSSPRSERKHWYCVKCKAQQDARDLFSDKVCTIFGLKMPGPRIWTERKRLIDTYGYTDDVIIDCLEYIYNVEKKKKLAESLYLINPITIDKMKQYKREQARKSMMMAQALNTETKEYVVPIRESKPKAKENLDPDEWLDID